MEERQKVAICGGDVLLRVREVREELEELWRRERELDGICCRTTSRWGGAGRGGGTQREELLAALADARGERRRCRRELVRAEREAEAFLERMEAQGEERSAEVLRCRYLRRWPWSRVRERMAELGYPCGAERTLFLWNRRALAEAERQWAREREEASLAEEREKL